MCISRYRRTLIGALGTISTISALLAATGLLGSTTTAQRADVADQTRLTTVLAELARSVSQDQGVAAPLGARTGEPFVFDKLPRSVQDAIHGGALRINSNDEVQVYILLREVTDATVSQLAAAGVTIEIADPAGRRVQARLPVSRLQTVAELPIVDAVRLPTYARTRSGRANAEGDAILYADAVRAQLALDGVGVRVGVISDGLKGVFAADCTSCEGVKDGPISTGDLPGTGGFRDAKGLLTSTTGGIVARSFRANTDLEGLPPATPACGSPGVGAEGTAMLEIVHDLAPGAKLSFANADTDLAFAQAVNFLAASNDVVVDDVGFYGQPYDGTSAVSRNTAAALNNPAYPIRAYFTAVGNDADKHYFGTFVDSGIEGAAFAGINSTGRLHLFQRTADTTDVLGLGSQPYNLIQLPQNGEVAIFLTWDDPFGASRNNYDLYLVQQSTGQIVASSASIQTGTQDPLETINYVNRGGQGFFRILVQNVQNGAQPKQLNLFSVRPECAAAGPLPVAPPRHERHNYNTASRSVAAQSDAGGSPVSAIAVGAICSASGEAAGKFPAGEPDESCLDTSNRTIEFFSSRGPTLDGRRKPDISAVDGVAVTGSGGLGSPFFGTSASAPHLGGIAALLLQSAPCLLNRTTATTEAPAARITLRDLILGRALRVSGSNPDNTFGAGRADAYQAVQATLPVWKGSAKLTVDANTPFGANLTPAQLGFSDPHECALVGVSWTGGCGTSPGVTMTCPVGTSAVAVSASNNGVSFSPATDMEIVVTDFSLGVTPDSATVTAGQSATFAVTVSPVGGQFNSEVTLSCANGNLPPQTTCSFDPETITPGTGPKTSRLTIATTSSSMTPAAAHRPELPPGWTGVMVPGPAKAGHYVQGPAEAGHYAPPMIAWPVVMAALWFAVRRTNLRRASVCALIAVAFAGVSLSRSGATAAAAASPMASGIALFPFSLTFGTQTVGTTAPPQLVNVTNIGADTLNLLSISSSGDFGVRTSCTNTLAAGGNCAVAVSFTPTAAGSRTGTLTFIDDAPGSPHTVSLTGTGQPAPPTSGGTPAGTYSVTISGGAGTLSHFTNLTLSVQ